MVSKPQILDDKFNFFTRGLLPERHYRFVLARNSAVTADISELHNASTQVSLLMGEAMMGCFFLTSHAAKQQKITVSLHLECNGPLRRLIATANNDGGIRAMSSNPGAEWEGPLHAGKGKGLLTVNRWKDDVTKVYSSTVEMRETSLDKNIEEYTGKSEQIQTFIKMESSFNKDNTLNISGYQFQALPDASFADTDAVVDMLAETSPSKMLDQFLQVDLNIRNTFEMKNIFHNIKILNNGKFFHHCGCSRNRVESMLLALGKESAEETLQSEGKIEIQCEFCKKFYYFYEEEISSIFKRN